MSPSLWQTLNSFSLLISDSILKMAPELLRTMVRAHLCPLLFLGCSVLMTATFTDGRGDCILCLWRIYGTMTDMQLRLCVCARVCAHACVCTRFTKESVCVCEIRGIMNDDDRQPANVKWFCVCVCVLCLVQNRLQTVSTSPRLE